jgi:Cu/Ag efflux protein CusF
MKIRLSSLLALLAFLPAALSAGDLPADKSKNCGCACCKGKEVCCCNTEKTAADQPVTHPLKGVIMDVMPEKNALLVKHEAVPGVMRAMTMMFKVEPAVLGQVKRDDAITARMAKRDDGWWLTEVEVVPPAK